MREQLYAGMTEQLTVAKKNVDIYQELKEVKAEQRILREKDKKAAERISILEDERTELREDKAKAETNISPDSKIIQRLLADYWAENEKNERHRKDIEALKKEDIRSGTPPSRTMSY